MARDNAVKYAKITLYLIDYAYKVLIRRGWEQKLGNMTETAMQNDITLSIMRKNQMIGQRSHNLSLICADLLICKSIPAS